MKVWFGVGYSLALMVHLVAINMNLLYGRKTTLRIFFINFTTMGVIWSFDALLSTVSSVYSIHGQSLHLYGNLGTLAWLLIISFHLLLSVSDGSPAVYFSVDNLVYYHVCGWLLPLGWVLLFFLLSTLKVSVCYSLRHLSSFLSSEADMIINIYKTHFKLIRLI